MKHVKLLTLLAIGLLLTSCGAGLPVKGGTGGTGSSPTDLTLASAGNGPTLIAADKEALLGAINAKRNSGFTCPAPAGAMPAVPAVTWSTKLEEMALRHTKVLVNVKADFNLVDPHSGVGDGNVSTRAVGVGYANLAIGENVAGGQINMLEVMTDWLASSSHCYSIMDADFTQVGGAKLSTGGGAYATYWTLNFGKPK
jgi:uncharacterized protein YkwD